MKKCTSISNYNYKTLSRENKSNRAHFFKPAFQPKTTINQPNDIYEQQANTMATKVMQMPDQNKAEPFFTAKPSINSIQKKCNHCQEEEKLQMKAGSDSSAGMIAPSVVHDVINSGGQSLDTDTRGFMESRFGYDFGNVQIHNDTVAHQSASDINALAYAHGNQIVFGKGQYQPNISSGKQLIAHELTHVVQQNATTNPVISRRTKQAGDTSAKESEYDKCNINYYTKKFGRAERINFVQRRFGVIDQVWAYEILDDMCLVELPGDKFSFKNEDSLYEEIAKRVKIVRLMQDPVVGESFGYPETLTENNKCKEYDKDNYLNNVRVNIEAKKYWEKGREQSQYYYFELSEEYGIKDAYTAINKLFTPQKDICNRTLIHCDYLVTILQTIAYADSIGKAEFNKLVATRKVKVILSYDGMDVGGRETPVSVSFTLFQPGNEADLIIGDHVQFWNYLAYTALTTKSQGPWRLENAILVDKDPESGENLYKGHGTDKVTKNEMVVELASSYDVKADRVLRLIKGIEAGDSDSQSEKDKNFPNVFKNVGDNKWYINSTGADINDDLGCMTKVMPLLRFGRYDLSLMDKYIPGLRNPCDFSKMNTVKRPINK